MYERLFVRPAIRNRHAQHPQAKMFEKYVYRLLDAGYNDTVVARMLCSWEAFMNWYLEKNERLAEINETVTGSFINQACQNRFWHGEKINSKAVLKWHHPALLHLLSNMRVDGFIPPVKNKKQMKWHTEELEKYRGFLKNHRGISAGSIKRHFKTALSFLEFLSINSWSSLQNCINAEMIDNYLLYATKEKGYGHKKSTVSSLRSILRYWHLRGFLDEDLSFLVPSVRTYRLASIPKALPWEKIQKMLSHIDRSTKQGSRDYAILLLLATYGFRSGEVSGLTLDDIDWRNKIIKICHSKTGKEDFFPLVTDVGEAIIKYLKYARPKSKHREVFLRLRAPFTPFKGSGGLYSITLKALKQIGVNRPYSGPHSLRHSRAVSFLNHGMSLKTIGDLFGHKSPESTNIYTKVDIETLKCASLNVTELEL